MLNHSCLQYLEERFGKVTRVVASVAFSAQTVLRTALVLYAASLALNAIAGVSQTVSMIAVGVLCVFYSTIGGIKAVIITDLFQVSHVSYRGLSGSRSAVEVFFFFRTVSDSRQADLAFRVINSTRQCELTFSRSYVTNVVFTVFCFWVANNRATHDREVREHKMLPTFLRPCLTRDPRSYLSWLA